MYPDKVNNGYGRHFSLNIILFCHRNCLIGEHLVKIGQWGGGGQVCQVVQSALQRWCWWRLEGFDSFWSSHALWHIHVSPPWGHIIYLHGRVIGPSGGKISSGRIDGDSGRKHQYCQVISLQKSSLAWLILGGMGRVKRFLRDHWGITKVIKRVGAESRALLFYLCQQWWTRPQKRNLVPMPSPDPWRIEGIARQCWRQAIRMRYEMREMSRVGAREILIKRIRTRHARTRA